MAETKVFINDLPGLTLPEDLLGKSLEVEGVDAAGKPISFKLPAGVLLQAAAKFLPGPNLRRDLRKSVQYKAVSQPDYNPGASSLDQLDGNLLSLGATATVEADEDGTSNTEYELQRDPTGPLNVWVDGSFTGNKTLARWVRKENTGGGGDTFLTPFTFSLSNGKSFGKYTNGQTAPWTGLTAVQAIQDAGIESIYPTYGTAGIYIGQSAPADGELGESITNNLQASFNQSDAGPLSQLRIYRNGVQVPSGAGSSNPLSVSVQMVRSLTPSGLYAVADYAAGPKKLITPGNTPDDRAPQVRNPNAPQAAEVGFQSGVIYYTGYYRIFYGPTPVVPTTSQQVRALAGSQLTYQGTQFILNSGTTERIFVVALPPGKQLVSVVDLDNLNQVITADYAPSTVSVEDAGGTPANYTQYAKVQAVPYQSNHRHLITTT
ncbi:hypothetical protein [Hymenobacter fodinae]|uniref:Uncharacterized protein n=1 Tax=Hymenobacter fodinae TaxID=2510796 RepID=A0A4Z0P3L4_9BACT|nr:hypothetical protein [Hymenobacter fodinae]TGE05548.1 hypothetical protein EU556_19810 [Hymenobacter fodinae]